MGSQNSGRYWRHDAKATVDGKYSIDVRQWKREGLLTHGRLFSSQWSRSGQVTTSIRVAVDLSRNYVVFLYRYQQLDGEWKDVAERVFLDRTPCNYGGQRMWFCCPGLSCNRRVGILYMSGRYFLCRKCCDLVYHSQREYYLDRETRQADKIRARLKWKGGIYDLPGNKPKGMRWRTFKRLATQYDAIVDRTCTAIDSMVMSRKNGK